MIIRSQDKKGIVNLNNIDTIDIRNNQIRYFNGGGVETIGMLGVYSTEEKAIKVLDMICNTYVETVWTYSQMIIANRVCFEMPSDEEVEV